MRCGRVRKQLSLFLDGRLGEAKKTKIEVHLAECNRCNREKELLSRTWETLQEWKETDAPPGFKAQFWGRITREKQATRRERKAPVSPPRLWRWSPALVTGIILFLAIGLYVGAPPGRVNEEEIQISGQLGLLENMEVIRNLDWLGDFEVIEQMEM